MTKKYKNVTIMKVKKNNGVCLSALMLSNGHPNTRNMMPAIYLEPFYSKYRNGGLFNAIIDEIVHIYEKNITDKNFDISFFTDYERVKDKIMFKIINYNKNKELLKDIPHRKILDLAIVFYCLAGQDFSEGSILIYNQHLSLWNISVDQLYEIAFSNTPEKLQYDFQNMEDLIAGIFGSDSKKCNDSIPMYVLTNYEKVFGASCILYNNLLHTLARKFNNDFYILPSSIHEVIIIPKLGYVEAQEELACIVKQINSTCLVDEEILSDSVYMYCRETKEITMWNF